jgi:hypothetical protein
MSLGRLLDVFIIFKNKFSFNKIILSVRDVLPTGSPLCTLVGEGSPFLASFWVAFYRFEVLIRSSADFQHENHAHGCGGSL